MRKITISTAFETADDGSISYYGGTFVISEGDISLSYYFKGNDIERSAVSCITDVLVDDFEVCLDLESDDKFDKLYELLCNGKDWVVLIDENNFVTCIEPI